MKPSTLVRAALVVALPCAGFLVAWQLAQRAPASGAVEPAPQLGEPRRAERRLVATTPGVAAPSKEDEPRPSSGEPWVELNNEATNDLTAGDLVDAVAKFERCLEAVPEKRVFRGNLVEALVRLARREHQRGQLEGAVEHLARALELGEERQDRAVLERILERWRRELELSADDWTEGSSRFELTYDTDRTDILHHSHEVLEHLERSYDDLVLWFRSDPLEGQPPIRVVLYEPEDFDRLTGLGDWAAGLFDGVVRVSLRDLEGGKWRDVLVHELVHAFVAALAGRGVPGWLNEGLAQMLEGRPGEVRELRQRLVGKELHSLERLSGNLADWQDSAAIALAYAESLVFVDFLRVAYGEEILRRMLRGLARGAPVEATFEEWSSVRLELAFDDWRASLERR